MDKKRLSILATGHFIIDGYGAFIPPILPLLMTELNLNLALTASLVSFLSFSANFFQPLVGYISDRISKPVFIFAGPLLSGFFISFINAAPSYWILVLFLSLGGLGIAAYHPQATAMVGSVSGKQRSTGLAIFVFGGTAGYSLGPLVVTFLISLGGLKAVYWACLPVIVFAILILTFFPFKLKAEKKKHLSLKSALKNASSDLYILLILSVIRAIVVNAFGTFIPLYFQELELPFYTFGLGVFILHFSGAVGGLGGGYLADRFGDKKILIASFILGIPFFVLFTMVSYPFSLVFIGIAGAFILSSMPVLVSAIQKVMPSHLGTVSSLATGFSWGLGGLFLPLLAVVAGHTGINLMLKSVSLLLAGGFILGFFLKKE